MAVKQKAEVVVIGAGIMGASLAYHLAKKGKQVMVLEESEICSGTSSSTQAWIWSLDKTPEHYAKLSRDAWERYRTLENELEAEFEYNICGSLKPFFDEEGLKKAEETVSLLKGVGYDVKLASREESLAMEPHIRQDMLGAVYCRDDGNVNPFLLVDSYIQSAKRLGAKVCTYTKVLGFVREGNRINEIITDRGNIIPELVVCAAGIYSRAIGKMLGLSAHVFPERGFCLVSEKMPKVLNMTVDGARQTLSGNIIFGLILDEVEEDCLDRRMYMRGLEWAAKDAAKLLPKLADANIIHSYAGIRCKPDDRFPIIGPTEKIENFWFHLSHSAYYLHAALSPMAAEIAAGERDISSLPYYKYSRFNNCATSL